MAQECDIKYTLMRFAIGTNKSGTVYSEHDIGIMTANIMNDLIIGPLHEGRVYCKYRLHPLHCERCAHRCCMLLGNADINHAVRKFISKFNKARSSRHRRCYCYNSFVLLRELNQCLTENFCIHRIANGLQHLTRLDFVRRDTMPFMGILLSRSVSLAFGCQHMNKHRTVYIIGLVK
ncbi:hypothetical protein D3C81_1532780 [compost metagenome]